jgi:uncharacterized protein YbjT (DUF2867 family)
MQTAMDIPSIQVYKTKIPPRFILSHIISTWHPHSSSPAAAESKAAQQHVPSSHRGSTVHALVRDPASPAALALKNSGAILFTCSFDSVPAIRAATVGVSGVFLNPFPGPLQNQEAQNFIDAALASKTVKTLVLSFYCVLYW